MNQPTGSSHLSYTLGFLSAVGGLSGFIKTGSKPSLIAGLGIGSLYIYGGYLINVGVFLSNLLFIFLIMSSPSSDFDLLVETNFSSEMQNGQSEVGHKVNVSAAVLLAGAMVPRYLKTKKIWPAGVMGAAGLMSLLYEGKKSLEWM